MTSPETTVAPADAASPDLTKRAWMALGVAEVAFTVFTAVFGTLAFLVADPDDSDGWGLLAFFVTLLVVGAACIVVGIPLAVHTVGRLTERATLHWSRRRAALAHLVVGLLLGAVIAAVVVQQDLANIPAAVVAFVVPAGLAGWVTSLLMPYAARHRWISAVAWVIAAVPILGCLLWGIGLATGQS